MSTPLHLLTSFLEETDASIREFEESSGREQWERFLGNTPKVVKNPKVLTTYLDKMVNACKELKVPATKASEFYLNKENQYRIQEKGLTVTLYNLDSISKIRPAKLEVYISKLTNLLDGISKGKASDADIDEFLNDPSYIPSIKELMVKTEIKGMEYANSKELLNFESCKSPDSVILVNNASEYGILLKKFVDEKVNSYVSGQDSFELDTATFSTLAKVIGRKISKVNLELDMIESSAKKVGIDSTLLAKLLYTTKLNLTELCKYLVAAAIRYMGCWYFTVTNLIDAQKRLEAMVTESSIKTEIAVEESGMEKLSIFNPESLLEICERITNSISAEIDTDNLETPGYVDKRSYDLIVQMLAGYQKNLTMAMDFYKEKNGNIPTDLIVRRYNLNDEAFFSTIFGSTISNKFFCANSYLPNLLKLDLLRMKRSILQERKLMNEITTSIHTFRSIIAALTPSDVHMEKEMELLDDRLDLWGSKIERGAIKIAELYLERLADIDMHLQPDVISLSPSTEGCDTFFKDALNANYDAIEESHEETLVNMQSYYEGVYAQSLYKTGIDLFLEDENNNQNNNTQNTGNNNQNNTGNTNNGSNNNTNAGNNNQNGDNGNSTTPKVQTNDNNNQQNNTNQKNNQNNNDQNQNNGNLVDSIVKFITNAKNKVVEFFNRDGAKKKNMDLITSVEDYLKSRNFVNNMIQILPFNNDVNYFNVLNGIVEKAGTLTDDQLRTMSEQQIYDFLLSDVNYKNAKGNTTMEKFENWLMVGNAEKSLINIRNNDIKGTIETMIDFTKNFYNTIESDLTNLSETAKSKLATLSGKKSQGDNDRTTENVRLVGVVVNKAVGSGMVVIRKRADDYMKVIAMLSADERKRRENGGNNNDQNNNNQNNNNQNQEQQNNNQNNG